MPRRRGAAGPESKLQAVKLAAVLPLLGAVGHEINRRLTGDHPDKDLVKELADMSSPELIEHLRKLLTAVRDPGGVSVALNDYRNALPSREKRAKLFEAEVIRPEDRDKLLLQQERVLEQEGR